MVAQNSSQIVREELDAMYTPSPSSSRASNRASPSSTCSMRADSSTRIERTSTSFSSTPRNLTRLSHMEEHNLIRMELTEARKIEVLMEQQRENARQRRLHNAYVRGWLPLLTNYRLQSTKRDIDLRRRRIALDRWKHNFAWLVDFEDRKGLGKDAIRRWFNLEKQRAWNTILAFSVGEGVRMKLLALTAMKHWRRYDAARAFNGLVVVQDARHTQRGRVRAAIACWFGRTRLRAFRSWQPHGARRRVVVNALNALVGRELTRAVRSWLGTHLEQLENGRLVLLGSGALVQRLLRKVGHPQTNGEPVKSQHPHAPPTKSTLLTAALLLLPLRTGAQLVA